MKKYRVKYRDSNYIVEADSEFSAARKVKDMALSRADAMERCISLGRKFIQHFDKIYKEPKSVHRNHWENEMQNWWGEVNRITLKNNNKKPLASDYQDWFFTAGESPKDNMVNPSYEELEAYDRFQIKVLSGSRVKEALSFV